LKLNLDLNLLGVTKMFEKLEEVERRYDTLSHLLSQPEVINNQAELQKVAREFSELGKVVDPYRRLKRLEEDIKENRQLLAGDEDEEMKGMIKEDLPRLTGAEKNRWRVESMSRSFTGVGGFKEVIALIEGKGAYSRLKYESGVHRVQRVPTTESQGRIHTSTVTVAILPEAAEVDVQIAPKH